MTNPKQPTPEKQKKSEEELHAEALMKEQDLQQATAPEKDRDDDTGHWSPSFGGLF